MLRLRYDNVRNRLRIDRVIDRDKVRVYTPLYPPTRNFLMKVGGVEPRPYENLLLRSYMPGRATREAVVEISMEGSDMIFS